MNWNIDLIPESDREKIKEWVANNERLKLMRYHNLARLSGDIECCDDERVYQTFKGIVESWN